MFNNLCLKSVSNKKSAAICSASKRFCSEEIRTIKNLDTAYLKRGTGGRSSFSGNVVTVFGATGFLGRYICNQLGKRGCQLIIPYRCDPDDTCLKNLKLCGDLGQVLFQPFHLNDPLSIRKAIRYSNVVINLIGRDFETANFNFYKVHVKGATEIATACKEYNVERFIHFSSLNLTKHPKRYFMKKLEYLPTKLQGEEAVREIFPTVTVFRPAAVYGSFDYFLWPLCARSRSTLTSIPLYAKGLKTIRQPVFASDVAQGVVNAINDYDSRGKIYQAVGPERYYLRDIALFLAQSLQRHTTTNQLVHDIKYDLLYVLRTLCIRNIAETFMHMPQRYVAFEFIEKESVTDVVDHSLPTLLDLGVPLTKLEDKVPNIIFNRFKHKTAMYRKYEDFKPIESLSAKAIKEFVF